jgi:predicted metal-dependent phosphoesterase TrpH
MTHTPTGRADLHIHTSISDGLFTPRQLLDHAARRGDLNVLAITDHDRIDGSLWAYARRDRYPFDIVPGVEVSSAEGHILALWVFEAVPLGLSMAETAAAIHEQGGIAILAHPYFRQMRNVRRAARAYRRDPDYLLRASLDGLEGFNAAVVLPGTNRTARRVARELGLAVTGGSDAHTLGAVGTGYTRFDGTTGDDLRAAIRNRSTLAAGRPWPLPEYRRFVIDFVSRRGKILLDELETLDADEDDMADRTALRTD